MRPRGSFLLCAVLALGAAGTSSTAATAAAPSGVVVRGTLAGHPGTVLLAVSKAGTATGVRLTQAGGFTLRLPKASARDTTLQLVRSDGSYGGPVVLAVRSGRAYIALAGKAADLGTLDLRSGYARVHRRLPNTLVDTGHWSRADSSGKPLGAGRLGLVRLGAKGLGASGAQAFGAAGTPKGGGSIGLGEDPDGDGVPSLFDADDNGNGTLDTVDPASAASNAGLYSILSVPFGQALNTNATGVTQPQIDEIMASDHAFVLGFFFDNHYTGGRAVSSVDVDCYTLVYCAAGTGTAYMVGGEPVRWATHTPDHSGLPNLDATSGTTWQAGIEPRVTTAHIHPGDTMAVNFRLAAGGTVSVPTSLATYFVTTPAITRWANSEGATDVTYPVTDDNAGQFTAPDGRITLTAWRPQRMGIAGTGEPTFVDMGHLHWGLSVGVNGRNEFGCGGYFSGLSGTLHNDWTGGAKDEGLSLFPLHDLAGDAGAGSGRVVTFTADLVGCLNHAGVNPAGLNVRVKIAAAGEGRPGGMDRAAQEFSVQLPS